VGEGGGGGGLGGRGVFEEGAARTCLQPGLGGDGVEHQRRVEADLVGQAPPGPLPAPRHEAEGPWRLAVGDVVGHLGRRQQQRHRRGQLDGRGRGGHHPGGAQTPQGAGTGPAVVEALGLEVLGQHRQEQPVVAGGQPGVVADLVAQGQAQPAQVAGPTVPLLRAQAVTAGADDPKHLRQASVSPTGTAAR